MMSLIGGRVIPFFTRSATGRDIQVPVIVDRAAMTLTPLALLAWVCEAPAGVAAVLLLGAALAQAVRVAFWQPVAARGKPILWALPLAYVWIPIGLALLAAAQWMKIPTSAGVHALAVGAAGGLVIAMITRTARGHTGRTLQAGRPETLAYLLTFAAAVLRVSAAGLTGPLQGAAIHLAGLMFAAAFLVYAFVYSPWLIAARADGRPD
jgi:uncharacterized protein involved in response to NO